MRAFEEGKATRGVECDVVTVNVLLDACAKSERPPGEALGILMDAIESRIPVDAYTISSLINAYCATRADAAEVLDQAFAIVELGRFLDVRQTPAVTNSLLRACVAAGDLPSRANLRRDRRARRRPRHGGRQQIGSNPARGVRRGGGRARCHGARGRRAETGRRRGRIRVRLARASVRGRRDVETATRAYYEATREHGVRPTLALVNALLAGLARGGSWREAIRVVSDDVIARDDVQADDALVGTLHAAVRGGRGGGTGGDGQTDGTVADGIGRRADSASVGAGRDGGGCAVSERRVGPEGPKESRCEKARRTREDLAV